MNVINQYFEEIKFTIDRIPAEKIEEIISILMQARINRQQIFIMGNGGSASTASHFVCDLAKNTRNNGLPGFRVIGLTDNMAIFSAYANDEGYETVFSQQLNNLLQPGDVVIAISASGNSRNVLQAVDMANQKGGKTIAFTGMSGGPLKQCAQTVIHVPSYKIDQVEDIHLVLEHIICRTLMELADAAGGERIEILPPKEAAEQNDPDELVGELFRKVFQMVQRGGSIDAVQEARAEIIQKICDEFSTQNVLHDLLSRILALTLQYFGAVGGSIVVLDENSEVIDGALAYGGEIQKRKTGQLTDTVSRGLAGWVIENNQPALVANTQQDPRWMPNHWDANLDLSRSAISVPLATQDRIIGVLTLTRLQANRFTVEDLSLLTFITQALSCSLESLKIERE
jgi:D-sedoheptulose 7-phosphate isomerase